jgi:SPP1 family predicted phage head-tail adaptor
MNFRKMRQRVKFQDLPRIDDGFGGNANNEDDWQDMLQTWGNMFPYVQGQERLQFGKLESETSHKLEIRYRTGFDPSAKYRVIYGSRVFDVLYFRNVNEANKVLEFRLKEVI